MRHAIYLDHAASAPIHPHVIAQMTDIMKTYKGNASSIHAFGRDIKRVLYEAKARISSCIGCSPDQLLFTSGGTESNNMAILGAADAYEHRGRHIITSSIEHYSVLQCCKQLQRRGYEVTYLSVDEYGMICIDQLKKSIRPDTVLISVMYGNNEIGTLQPIQLIGQLARERSILFHTDVVQALGTETIYCDDLSADLITFSSHKIGGPQGVGMLYTRSDVSLSPLMFGGLQQNDRRAGTENVAGIVGFATAVELVNAQLEQRRAHFYDLHQKLICGLEATIDRASFRINGHPRHVLSHITNVSFLGIDSDTMLIKLDLKGIAVANGSACTSGSAKRSHVLQAMGLPADVVSSAVRFSFGMENTTEQIDSCVKVIGDIIRQSGA